MNNFIREDAPKYTFKILMIGESCVGKSSLVERYCDGTFTGELTSTIGIDFQFKIITVAGIKIKLQIWDTAGQEKFHNVTSSYYRGSHGCVVVYDVNEPKTFDKLNYWITEYRNEQPTSELVVVGNKIDKGNKVELSAIDTLKEKMNCQHFFTSAATGKGVDEVFVHIAENILKNQKGFLQSNNGVQITTVGVQTDSSCC